MKPTPPPDTLRANLRDHYDVRSDDLFEKCRRFDDAYRAHERAQGRGRLHRVMLTSGLDRRIRVRTDGATERELICFDSNSYLHLHRHPRVIDAVRRGLDRYGYGTPSAQMLCGTNVELRNLEETISRFHGREDTVVFSSGYAANLGTLTGLLRRGDLVVRDASSHTSIHDGCRASRAQATLFPHADMVGLERALRRAGDMQHAGNQVRGKLVVSDGVFSMQGDLAPLPALLATARRHDAYVMLDEAHATGIVGATGRGTEEHFGVEGQVDILMGTFSKAPGTIGGYVTGRREMVRYLRFYANAGMFSAALPAALCAGVREAFEVMAEEPQHREQLWRNVHALADGLRQVGWDVPAAPQSAILPLFVGEEELLWAVGAELFAAGVKAGAAAFPAVSRGEAMIRLTVNARHTSEDIARTIAILERLGARHGLLHRGRDEVRAVGRHFASNLDRGAA